MGATRRKEAPLLTSRERTLRRAPSALPTFCRSIASTTFQTLGHIDLTDLLTRSFGLLYAGGAQGRQKVRVSTKRPKRQTGPGRRAKGIRSAQRPEFATSNNIGTCRLAVRSVGWGTAASRPEMKTYRDVVYFYLNPEGVPAGPEVLAVTSIYFILCGGPASARGVGCAAAGLGPGAWGVEPRF